MLELACRLSNLSVRRSVCPVGELWKTANWIWMPFGVVSEGGRRMGVYRVLDGGPHLQGKGEVWGEVNSLP